MKCPKCSGKVQRGRQGMKCSCGYAFKLDPKGRERYSDAKMLALIDGVSSGGTTYYTAEQLWTRYCKKHGTGWVGCLVFFAIVATVIGFFIWRKDGPPTSAIMFTITMLSVFLGLFTIAWMQGFRSLPTGGRQHFDLILDKWRKSKGDLEKLIDKPRLHEPPPEWTEADIYDYGVERILVVQRDLLVDLFVLNDLHIANRCIVISVTGYPDYMTERARAIMTERPDTPVFVLHDSTPEGMETRMKLRKSELLPLDQTRVVDLGLIPGDVKKLKRLRPIRPSKTGYGVPVDALLYTNLALAVGMGMDQMIPIGMLMDPAMQRAAADGGGGGFG